MLITSAFSDITKFRYYMRSRKELKKQGRAVLKKHYLILVAVCIISAYLGVEFTTGYSDVNVSSTAAEEAEAKTSSSNLLTQRPTNDNVLKSIMLDNMSDSEKESSDIVKTLENENSSRIIGRTRGFLAQAVNNVQAGKVYIAIANIRLFGSLCG